MTGGGSGHEPAFLGYVGKNMVDAVAVGEVFSSPSAQAFYDAFMEADAGKGVACLFGNYAGDNMNVKMAVRKAKKAGVTVKYVTANDDVASSPKKTKEKRHGIAGGVFMWKIGGARAAKGGDLDEVIASAQKAVDNTRSICARINSMCHTRSWSSLISILKKEAWRWGSDTTGSRASMCRTWSLPQRLRRTWLRQ